MSTKTIKSVSKFIDILKSENAKDTNAINWYRGQVNKEWGLIPSLLRTNFCEEDLISKFKQNAKLLISSPPVHELEWLLIMQHYAMPTRLLDWSDNPLVALYFAVVDEEQSNNEKDGAFWILSPTKLNELANIKLDEVRIPSTDDKHIENYFPSTLKYEKTTSMKPIAIIPPRNTQRMQAQSGVFTIWHRDITPIEKLEKGSCVSKYIIPADSKLLILNELNFLGFNRFRLFPELSSIAALIKEGR